jgi:hypothetical protein
MADDIDDKDLPEDPDDRTDTLPPFWKLNRITVNLVSNGEVFLFRAEKKGPGFSFTTHGFPYGYGPSGSRCSAAA